MTPGNVALAALLLLPPAHVAALWDHLEDLDRFRGDEFPHAPSILRYCFAIAVLGLITTGLILWKLARPPRFEPSRIRSWALVRAWFYLLFFSVVATSLAHTFELFAFEEFLARSIFTSTMLGLWDLWAVAVLVQPPAPGGRAKQWMRFADVALANLIGIFLLLEAAIVLAGKLFPSRFAFNTPGASANVEMWRPEPHSPFFGFNLNSGGYHDAEFFAAEDDDFVVAILADSFGAGVVPHSYNFTTVIENRLVEKLAGREGRVAAHNFGLPGIGMPEYAHLLQHEVLATNPACVVLCVFAGNDIWLLKRGRLPYLLQTWSAWSIGKGVLALWAESRQGGHVLEIGKPDGAGESIPDYIHDTRKEPPTFSEKRFLEIESGRMEILNPESASIRKEYREFMKYLEAFHSRLGSSLIVVVIPDEFQVNDELFEQLLATRDRPGRYKRNYPQERIRSFCETKGIPMLDLLPVLRDANREDRVYHLRDTHWNARGNQIAGEAIAHVILEHHGATHGRQP